MCVHAVQLACVSAGQHTQTQVTPEVFTVQLHQSWNLRLFFENLGQGSFSTRARLCVCVTLPYWISFVHVASVCVRVCVLTFTCSCDEICQQIYVLSS